MTASTLKSILISLGAELCGIAGIDRFGDAPKGFHPTDVMKDCKSVITFARRFPVVEGTLTDHNLYTKARDDITDRMDEIADTLCDVLSIHGINCTPISTCDSVLDESCGRWRSKVSIKHATQACGIGTIGRHSLVISPEFGCMMWLGCVLSDAEFESDSLKEPICEKCNRCVEACPVGALNGELVDQLACDAYAYTDEGIVCHRCRDACPYNFGTLNADDSIICYYK